MNIESNQNFYSRDCMKQIMRVYLVTDEALCRHYALMDVVQMVVQAGVTCVQLRDKHLATGAFVEKARAMKQMMMSIAPKVPLLINDRVDVALAAQADGVHVGQSDMSLADVRDLMPQGILGWSVQRVEHIEQVHNAAAKNIQVDYLGVGPIFFTATKSDIETPIGLEGIRNIRALTNLPLVAIGGIDELNAESVVRAGVDGVAVVSALCSAKEPEVKTKSLIIQVNKGLGDRL